MQKITILLLSLLCTLTLTAQNKQKAPNGWEYTIQQEGKGQKVTRQNGLETHMRLTDAHGQELFSTYAFGLPDYQTLANVPEPYQIAAELMSQGSKYTFYVPMGDFKKGIGQGMPAELPGDHVVWELEILKVLPGKPSIADIVYETMEKESADAAFQKFNTLVNNPTSEVYINEGEVNDLGYGFLGAGKTQEAISVFKYNLKMYPHSANTYDSLAEALAKAGEKQAAISYYQQSLAINPNNENARKMLAELEKQ